MRQNFCVGIVATDVYRGNRNKWQLWGCDFERPDVANWPEDVVGELLNHLLLPIGVLRFPATSQSQQRWRKWSGSKYLQLPPLAGS
jgi:hypothetical protein